MQLPHSIRRALLDTNVVRDALIHSESSVTNLVVLICDTCPNSDQREAIERILQEAPLGQTGWGRLYLPALPLDGNGHVDTQALSNMARGGQQDLSPLQIAFSALPEVDECAALLCPAAHKHPAVHLDMAVPNRRADTLEQATHDLSQSNVMTPHQAPPSLAKGAELPPLSIEDMDIAARLEQAVHTTPARFVLIAPDGDEVVMSTTDVWTHAGNMAGQLHAQGAENPFVLLFSDDYYEAVAGFWACLRLRKTAAVLTPPRGDALEQPDKGLSKLSNIWKMLDRPPVAAAPQWLANLQQEFGADSPFYDIQSLLTSDGHPPALSPLESPDEFAVITFTSGSTGLPKAVPTTFRNLCSMHANTHLRHSLQPEDTAFNWLPIDHLGPLNFFSLMPALRGSDQVHTATENITKSPLKLLDYMSKWRCTNTWAPNFAFNLINAEGEALQQAIRESKWDLSHVRLLINAGEAVTDQTTHAFFNNLAPCNLRKEAITPAFGMAETVTGVSYQEGIRMAKPDSSVVAGEYVDLGSPCPGIHIRITDDNDTVISQGTIGQLQLRGDQILDGYYRNPEANADSFTHDGWFKTGDLAFMRDDHLFVTGRAKEIIIINGLNYFCHELEAATGSVSGVTSSMVAAVAFRPPGAATEALALFFHPEGLETEPGTYWAEADGQRIGELIQNIKATVAAKMAATPALCLPLGRDGIPRTGTGKIQRVQMANALMAGEYDDLIRAVDILLEDKSTLPPWFHSVTWQPCALRPDLSFTPSGTWLVLHQGNGEAVEIATALEGLSATVTLSNIKEQNNIRSTLDTLRPDHIVDTCTLADAAITYDFFCSLAHHSHEGGELPTLHILTQNSVSVRQGDTVFSDKAGLPALVASLAKETGCKARLVDCGHGMSTADMMHELTHQYVEPEIAWRGGTRLALRLSPIQFPIQGSLPPLQTNQHCIVTGGLGGVGTLLIKHLLEDHQANITIVGRTDPAQSAQTQKRLRALEDYARPHGTDVRYATVDVSDPEALATLLKKYEQAGPTRVFHLAGTERIAPLHQETPNKFMAQWRAKAGATSAFLDWLRQGPERSLCVFSSSNNLYPTMGTAAYATANRAMDEMIHEAHLQGLPVQSLAWSTWEGTGMGTASPGEELLRANGLYGLEPERALLSYQALKHHAGRMTIGLDPNRTPTNRSLLIRPYPLLEPVVFCQSKALPSVLLRQARRQDAAITTPIRTVTMANLPKTNDGLIDEAALGINGENGAKEARQPATKLESLLLSVFRRILEIPAATVEDNFFALGGHSLAAARYLREIKQQLGVDIPLDAFFRNATVAMLARRISQQEAAPEKLEAMATIRLQLDAMSPEELRAKLQELSTKRK